MHTGGRAKGTYLHKPIMSAPRADGLRPYSKISSGAKQQTRASREAVNHERRPGDVQECAKLALPSRQAIVPLVQLL
jgi:hypothetical protein